MRERIAAESPRARNPDPMATRLPLRINFLWTFAGNGVYAACQWAMLVLFAKLGTPALVGEFALALALTAPIILFSNLQLRGVQATDARDLYRFGDYFGLRLVTTALAVVALVLFAFASGQARQTTWIIVAVTAIKGFESLSDLSYGLLQQHERMDRIAISMITTGLFSLGALAAGLQLTHSPVVALAVVAATRLVLFVAYDMRQSTRLLAATGQSPLPRFDWPTQRQLVTLSLPLGLVTLLVSLNANIPRYFVEHLLGSAPLGIFAALAYLMVAGNIVILALGQSASPRLARLYAAGDAAGFRRLLGRLCALGVALGAAGVALVALVGRPLLTLLYRPEYATHQRLLLVIMVAAAVSYVASFIGFAVSAARYFKSQVPLFIVVDGLTALGCLGLVRAWGLDGAAWALVLGAAAQLVGSLFIVRHALASLPRR
jgi:O-antigen/teichoic acid export membrane protein